MAKAPTLTTVTTGWLSSSQINQNFDNIESAFDNTLSRDGSTPNTMSADLDLNGNDLLNVGTLQADALEVGGTNLTASVAAAGASATAAATSASAAASSASSAASSASTALSVVDSLPDWQGAWVTATAYAVGDLVRETNNVYICLVAHTSGTFATDLSSAYWELFVGTASGTGTGDLIAANNLSDVASIGAAQANLGIVPSGGGTYTGAVTFQSGATYQDSAQVNIGNSSDMRVYHDGINSFIINDTGKLYIESNLLFLRSADRTSNFAVFQVGGDSIFQRAGVTRLTLTSTGATVAGALSADTAAGNWFLDEDDMASNSDTKIASQQSIKAYVDTTVSGSAVGVGQTWQDVKASRAAGISYQNTTGKPIMVNMTISASSASSIKYVQVSSDNLNWVDVGNSSVDDTPNSVIVPDNWYYRVQVGARINKWAELR